MKEIPLTQGKVALVDDEDYERLVAMGKWYCSTAGYAVLNINFRKPNGRRGNSKKWMHREVLFLEISDGQVDHKDRDKLNNQKINLRQCNGSENCRNRESGRNSTGFHGVTYQKTAKKYRADIRFLNNTLYLGLFTCPIEAAKAYNEAAIKYHGEFANLNPI